MKAIHVLFLLIFVFSCSMPESDNFKFDSPRFENVEEACLWINNNIRYKKDANDYWKLPQETLDDRSGDCEDQALLLMGIVKYQMGDDLELIVVDSSGNYSEYHALARKGNTYYDCTNGSETNGLKYNIVSTYDYDSAMYTARYIKNY